MKSPKALIPGLVLTMLTFAACERMEPTPEMKVLLQATGTVGDQDATLQIRAMNDGFAVIARDKLTQTPLFAGFVPGSSLSGLMKGVRGPLRSSLSGSTLRVVQEGQVEKAVSVVTGPQAGAATQGTFQFEGSRYLRYNAGLLEHGLDGHIHVILKSPDGNITTRFDGLTTHEGARNRRRSMNPERVAVATHLWGQVTGALSLGGGLMGGNSAQVSVDLANGGGAVEMSSLKQTFDFSPTTDITPPGGSGSVQLVTSSSDYVELTDAFQGHVANSHVHLEKGKTASGSADIQYNVTLAITPDKILTVGSASISSSVETSEGKKAEFHGSNDQIQTELDW